MRAATRTRALVFLVSAVAIAVVVLLAVDGGRGAGRSASRRVGDAVGPIRHARGSAGHAIGRSRRVHGPAAVTLEWVGDIALSTERGLPPGGVAHALAPLRGTLRDADLTLGNLEGTLSSGGTSKCGDVPSAVCFAFQAPPSAAFALRRLGFDLVNQANNHAQDYGADGHAQTLAALRAAHLAWTGDPGQITYLAVHGVRVAFLGFAPYPYAANLLDIPAARALVRRAARHAALVVVIIHAGAEGADELHTPRGTETFLGENRGNPRAFAHAVISAGASVVLGSGPHVIRGVQRVRGRLVAYSLGNFVGYHTLEGGGVLDDSGILRLALDPRSGVLTAARWIPVTLDGGLPRRAAGDGDVSLLARLSREDFPKSHYDITTDGRFALPARAR